LTSLASISFSRRTLVYGINLLVALYCR